MRLPRGTALALALTGLVALAACRGDKAKSSSDTTTSSTAVPGTSTSGAPSSTTSSAVTALTGASLTPVSTPVAGRGLLTAVRTSVNPSFDRVVFELDGEAPGYSVQYSQRPVQEDGSGNTVNVRGDSVLEVRMAHASGADLSGGTFRQTYTGPKQIAVNGPAVVEVVRAGDFEGVLRWVVGTTGRLPFKAQLLTGPNRLVVDVAHPGTQ